MERPLIVSGNFYRWDASEKKWIFINIPEAESFSESFQESIAGFSIVDDIACTMLGGE